MEERRALMSRRYFEELEEWRKHEAERQRQWRLKKWKNDARAQGDKEVSKAMKNRNRKKLRFAEHRAMGLKVSFFVVVVVVLVGY